MDINPEEFARPDVAKEKDVSIPQGKPFAEENRYFGRVDNGPYQLGHLFRELPSIRSPITSDEVLKAKAARQHADNQMTTLMHGLGVIGSLMVYAGVGEECDLDSVKVTELGELIQHLSCEMRFLREMHAQMGEVVQAHELQTGGV